MRREKWASKDIPKADFFSIKVERNFPSEAITLKPKDVGAPQGEVGTFARKHRDGWEIRGEVKEDYFYWVNEFEAEHPKYGKVWGDWEEKVHATSEQSYNHFRQNHIPHRWDYHDIG